jgi:hypothetical protein
MTIDEVQSTLGSLLPANSALPAGSRESVIKLGATAAAAALRQTTIDSARIQFSTVLEMCAALLEVSAETKPPTAADVPAVKEYIKNVTDAFQGKLCEMAQVRPGALLALFSRGKGGAQPPEPSVLPAADTETVVTEMLATIGEGLTKPDLEQAVFAMRAYAAKLEVANQPPEAQKPIQGEA